MKKTNKKEETGLVSDEDELRKDSDLEELDEDEESPKKDPDDWDEDF